MINLFKKILILSAFFLLMNCEFVSAQNMSAAVDTAYQNMIAKRSDKIVSELQLKNQAKADRVSKTVARQYSNLNDIDNLRDNKIKEAKAKTDVDKATTNAAIAAAKADADAKTEKLHKQYLAELSKELTADQVATIKDGMTYNVMPLTYNAYLDELPTLTEPQKAQIKAWLIEAREHAIDGGSSKEKHAWFGKYKGRINNYLSAQGYDMKKAGEEWQQRIKARNAAKADNKSR